MKKFISIIFIIVFMSGCAYTLECKPKASYNEMRISGPPDCRFFELRTGFATDSKLYQKASQDPAVRKMIELYEKGD